MAEGDWEKMLADLEAGVFDGPEEKTDADEDEDEDEDEGEGEGDEGERELSQCDAPKLTGPLAEDAMNAESGRDLTERINDVMEDLEWRRIARNKQANAIAMLEDLEKSPAELRAEWKVKAWKRRPPDSTRAAHQLLGRILSRCESAVEDALNSSDAGPARFGLAAQLIHAASRVAQMMDQTDEEAQGIRRAARRPRRGE